MAFVSMTLLSLLIPRVLTFRMFIIAVRVLKASNTLIFRNIGSQVSAKLPEYGLDWLTPCRPVSVVSFTPSGKEKP